MYTYPIISNHPLVIRNHTLVISNQIANQTLFYFFFPGPWMPIFKPSAKVKSLPLHRPPSSHSYTNSFPSLHHEAFKSFGSPGLSGHYPSREPFPTTGHSFPAGDHFLRAPVPTAGDGLTPGNHHTPRAPTAEEGTPGNRHMIHVHLIPHLYVPIVNQAGGSEDHKVRNTFSLPTFSSCYVSKDQETRKVGAFSNSLRHLVHLLPSWLPQKCAASKCECYHEWSEHML